MAPFHLAVQLRYSQLQSLVLAGSLPSTAILSTASTVCTKMSPVMLNLMDEQILELITTAHSKVEIATNFEVTEIEETSNASLGSNRPVKAAAKPTTITSPHHMLLDIRHRCERCPIRDPDAFARCHRCRGIHQHHRITPLAGGVASRKVQICEVIPGLSISNVCTGLSAVYGLDPTTSHFTHVLSFHDGTSPRAIEEHTPPPTSKITSKQIHMLDCPYVNIIAHFPEICIFIHQALTTGGKTLVHCRAGVSRSASAVIAYLMWSRHWSFETALDRVKEVRSFVNPNAGFRAQLRLWEALECELIDVRTGHEKQLYTAALRSYAWSRDACTAEPDLCALEEIERPILATKCKDPKRDFMCLRELWTITTPEEALLACLNWIRSDEELSHEVKMHVLLGEMRLYK